MAGYPWQSGQVLTAADLDAAFTNLPTVSSVTATGSTASRTLASRAADVFNTLDDGAVGDGVTNNTAAFARTSARLAAAGGGVFYVPRGRFLVRGTTLLPSNSEMRGDGPGSVILADSSWPSGTTYQFVFNQNYAASSITDANITVSDLTFDYGSFPAGIGQAATYGATHAVSMRMVRNVTVRNCIFQHRGVGNDATAFLGCDTTLVDGCASYDHINCAYDHWTSPRNAKIVNCSATTAAVGPQMVNFNPENTTLGTSAGQSAENFVLSNNVLECTGATAMPMQLEPLEIGTTVKNVVVTGNIFKNVTLAMRGAVSGVVLSDNVFAGPVPPATGNVLAAYPAKGGNPSDYTIAGNLVTNPATTTASILAVYMNSATIIGNRITGTSYGTQAGIDTSTYAPTVIGNSVSNGITNHLYAVAGTGGITATNGNGFQWYDNAGSLITWRVAASDNNHVLYGTDATGGQRPVFGIGQRASASPFTVYPVMLMCASSTNYVRVDGASTGTGPAISATGGDTNIALRLLPKGSGAVAITGPLTASGGIDNTAIGATTPSSGAFTTLSASTTMNATGWLSWGNPGNSASIPSGAFWGAAGTNFTSGQAEVDFWNTFNSPAQSFIFWQRVTAGPAATRLMDIGPTGNLRAYGGIDNTAIGATTPAAASVTQLNLTTSAGPNIRSGTGAASGTQPKGSLWMRTDGGVGTTMYVSQGGGTWNPVAGV